MQLCKVQDETGALRIGLVEGGEVRFLDSQRYPGLHTLSDILHSGDAAATAWSLIDDTSPRVSLDAVTVLAPVDRQEGWAAGVTYIRRREASGRESDGATRFYEPVYQAESPALV